MYLCMYVCTYVRTYVHTGRVCESGYFKNIINNKCFLLFSFNEHEHNVYIKGFRFFHFQFNPFSNLTH